MRGEYRTISRTVPPHTELPPRARRIQCNERVHGHHGGTTSACAENTQIRCYQTPTRSNYLRVRGEYPMSYRRFPTRPELPPRARRIRSTVTAEIGQDGTTSACAENTLVNRSRSMISWNYLRVRGEYGIPGHMMDMDEELPPRARRIPSVYALVVQVTGTTSACAENTMSRALSKSSIRNYLRVRGEYKPMRMTMAPHMELPPRARRILGLNAIQSLQQGTTSACAENTRWCHGW